MDVFIRGDFFLFEIMIENQHSTKQTNQRITCNLRFSNWEVMYQKIFYKSQDQKLDFDKNFFFLQITPKIQITELVN